MDNLINKSYKALFSFYKYQPNEVIFAHFPYEKGETWETPFIRLAQMAKKETWSFTQDKFRNEKRNHGKVPILRNYLNYTFLRLQEESKIKFSKGEDKACFNTGLQTARGKDIYATFFLNKQADRKQQTQWKLYNFFDSYSTKLQEFSPLPEIASYIQNPIDLVFDTSYKIETNLDHFLENNLNRLPPALQDNPMLAQNAINGAVDNLVDDIKRNYKIAIPHWYRGKIQLLLPLVLTNDDGIAEVALVVDRDDTRKIYRGTTILEMDMAYVDARLITKPADDWLVP